MRKYIIYKKESGEKGRAYHIAPDGHKSITWILAETYDSSDRPIPKPGERVLQFTRTETDLDVDELGGSTHSREGDWEVRRVHTFEPTGEHEYDLVVICYCCFVPIEPNWQKMQRLVLPTSDCSAN
ncbi:MAG: hypothetical protein WA919_03990 [Coleofasciculaceae cyanobacterium]